MGTEKPGMQFEFHIRGHHHKKKKHGKKEHTDRTSVWYERYIILTLPPEDLEDFYVGYSQPKRQERKFQDDENSAVLPYWWLVGKDKEGRVYYINNFQKKTQWNPPTPEQIAEEKQRMNEILPPPA